MEVARSPFMTGGLSAAGDARSSDWGNNQRSGIGGFVVSAGGPSDTGLAGRVVPFL